MLLKLQAFKTGEVLKSSPLLFQQSLAITTVYYSISEIMLYFLRDNIDRTRELIIKLQKCSYIRRVLQIESRKHKNEQSLKEVLNLSQQPSVLNSFQMVNIVKSFSSTVLCPSRTSAVYFTVQQNLETTIAFLSGPHVLHGRIVRLS